MRNHECRHVDRQPRARALARALFALVLSIPVAAAEPFPGEAAYLVGHDLLRAARYGDAMQQFQEAGEAGGPLAPYALIRVGYCRDQGGDPAGAIAAYEQVLHAYPEGPWVSMAKASLATALYHERRYADAAALLAALLDAPALPRWLEEYRWLHAEILTHVPGQSAAGYDLFAAILDGIRYRRDRERAAEWLAKSPDAGHRLKAVDAFLRLDDYRTAGLMMAALSVESSTFDEDRAAYFTFLLGRLQAAGSDPAPGRLLLQQVADDRKGTELGGIALGYLARNYILADRPDAAAPLVHALVASYPRAEATGDTLWTLGRHYTGEDEPENAAKAYRTLANVCPDHHYADDGLFEAGKLQHESGAADTALKTLGELAHRFPHSSYVADAGYLMGRIYEDKGDINRAKAAYTQAVKGHLSDFYAHRAQARLDAIEADAPAVPAAIRARGLSGYLHPIPVRAANGDDAPGFSMADEWYRRLVFFASHGMEEAEWEGWHALQSLCGTGREGDAYRALSHAGLMAMAVQVMTARGWGMTETGPTRERLEVLYPRGYWPIARAMGREAVVDPYLMMAVARQESLFQARVESHAGARGVMQIMPGTADWMAQVEPSVSATHVANLDNPHNSLRLGAYYMARMVARSDGNLVYALASYNAGPGNLSKWRRQFDTPDMDAFIERIPFTETRNYVKKVLGNYAAYYSLYEGIPAG